MPRYFFHVTHERRDIGQKGEELADKQAAWKEATVMAGQILQGPRSLATKAASRIRGLSSQNANQASTAMIGSTATPISTNGAGSLPVRSLIMVSCQLFKTEARLMSVNRRRSPAFLRDTRSSPGASRRTLSYSLIQSPDGSERNQERTNRRCVFPELTRDRDAAFF